MPAQSYPFQPQQPSRPIFRQSHRVCMWQSIPWSLTLQQWASLNQALSAAPQTQAPAGLTGAWRQVVWGGHTFGLLTPLQSVVGRGSVAPVFAPQYYVCI
jgi:hypothetical protein